MASHFGKVSPIFPGMLRPPSEISMTANIKVAERKCYINGQFVGSGRQFAKINPVDGTVVAQFTRPTARWSTRRCVPRRVR